MDQIPRWKNDVLKKDKDKVIVIDGREGSGKSALAQQLASNLDPEFNIDKITFTAEEFMNAVKSPSRKKGDCIILDEAFLAANSRSAMSQINKAMVGLATEMRQLNLFVIICLPSFFDLDKYFALWRTDLLIHTYFDKQGNRGRYILWGASKKKQLYLNGKKFYNYSCVKSPYPACRFNKGYAVEEEEYRKRKQEAFRKEKVSQREVMWKERALKLIKEFKLSPTAVGEVWNLNRKTITNGLSILYSNPSSKPLPEHPIIKTIYDSVVENPTTIEQDANQ